MIFIWMRIVIENYFQIKDFALILSVPSFWKRGLGNSSPLRSRSAKVMQAPQGACVTSAWAAVKDTRATPEATEAVYLIIKISLTNWSFP